MEKKLQNRNGEKATKLGKSNQKSFSRRNDPKTFCETKVSHRFFGRKRRLAKVLRQNTEHQSGNTTFNRGQYYQKLYFILIL
jgi:hypothetical protein